MTEWLVPALIALGGGTGIGAVITPLVTARGSAKNVALTQLNALVDQLQEDRKEDRAERKALNAKVENVLELYHIEREHSTELLAWGLNGAPPPPPTRRTPTAPTE